MQSSSRLLFLLVTALLLSGCGAGFSGKLLQENAVLISPASGSYIAPQTVTLSGEAPGVLICYSWTGDPVIAGGQCSVGTAYAQPVTIPSSGATMRVVADAIGLMPSRMSTATYTLLYPQVSLNVTELAFETQLAGTASAGRVVTLTNTGAAPLIVSGVALAGDKASAFSERDSCLGPVAIGANCTLTVGFTPAGVGSFGAALQISANTESALPPLSLSGTGTLPVATLSASALQFPSTDVGVQSAEQEVQLSNNGSAPLSIAGISLGGPQAAAFRETSSCATSLAVGGSCMLHVVFAPGTAVDVTAQLTIADNAVPGTQMVSLEGIGRPGTPLSTWQDAYRRCQSEVVNVVVLGDSRSIVDTTVWPAAATPIADTFGQKWPDLLRATLEAVCGSHGSGVVPLLPRGGFNDLNGDYYKGTGSWTTIQGPGPYQFGGVPAGMTLVATSALTIGFNPPGTYDHLNAYCVSGPGLQPWTLTIDGQTVGACGGGEGLANQAVVATSSAVALGTHQAAMTCPQSPCVAYGMETTAGTTGVSVHNLAVGSCAAECFGLNPPWQLAFSDLIAGGHQLMILGMVTNDPGVGYSVDSFRGSLGNIIEHERALPGSPSVLIYAPLQDNLPGQGPYYPVLPEVATGYATAYFDVRDGVGDGFLPQYFGPDGAHENNAGQDLIYQRMISALLP